MIQSSWKSCGNNYKSRLCRAAFALGPDNTEDHPSGQDMPAAPETVRSGEGKNQIRILVVDDYAVMREGLTSLLEKQEGFEVVGQAKDGSEAVDLAEKRCPDVVLMDVSMPNMDGIEATGRIAEGRPEIAVIGLSMHDDSLARRDMIAAGAVSYLCKSDPAGDIIRAVRQAAVAKKG